MPPPQGLPFHSIPLVPASEPPRKAPFTVPAALPRRSGPKYSGCQYSKAALVRPGTWHLAHFNARTARTLGLGLGVSGGPSGSHGASLRVPAPPESESESE